MGATYCHKPALCGSRKSAAHADKDKKISNSNNSTKGKVDNTGTLVNAAANNSTNVPIAVGGAAVNFALLQLTTGNNSPIVNIALGGDASNKYSANNSINQSNI